MKEGHLLVNVGAARKAVLQGCTSRGRVLCEKMCLICYIDQKNS